MQLWSKLIHKLPDEMYRTYRVLYNIKEITYLKDNESELKKVLSISFTKMWKMHAAKIGLFELRYAREAAVSAAWIKKKEAKK